MESLNLIKNDPWLAPYKEAIEGRYQYVVNKEKNLTGNGRQTLSEMASGYLYFGLHKTKSGWVFREWAPNATAIYMIGTFNEWKKDDRYKLQRLGNGIWEIALAEGLLRHEDLFKLLVEWEGGCGERIPAWIRRVVQDENTKIFSAQVWNPEKPYVFKHKRFKPNVSPLLIYECHIGMASNEEKSAVTTNSVVWCCPVLRRKDIMPFRLWLSRNILIMVRSVIMSAVFLPHLPVLVRRKN